MVGAAYGSPFTDQVVEIPNNCRLYRLILPSWVDWNAQQLDGSGPRLKRVGFQDYSPKEALAHGYEAPCLSVALDSVLEAHGVDPVTLPEVYGLPPTYGVAWLSAESARSLAQGPQGIMLRPEANKPWHAIVFCLHQPKKSGGMERGLAASAHWLRIAVKPSP